tara:strand:+ start:900 stop:1019 length:120 start_codon:yes stop_codon:yes gene_type:complete
MPDIKDGAEKQAERKKNKKYVQLAVKSQRKDTEGKTSGR